ncbi:MAG: ExbD/TolR family protein [Gemmatimonadales bacterium]
MPAVRPYPSELTTEINVLPLIDILLVMVIAFLLAQRDRAVVDLPLPPPVAAGPAAPHQIVLEIAADGGIAVNGFAIPDEKLESTLAAIYRDRPTKLLFLKASGTRPYGEVVRVVQRSRTAGGVTVAMMPRAAP